MKATQQTPGLAAALSDRISNAEHDAQAARYSGDKQALGYAEARALQAKRQLAALDPRGAGHAYLGLLTQDEREKAMRSGK